MNIKKAKQQIINTVRAYLEKDGHGRYMIPVSRQRPICLIGAPGIGKTEIMSQAAAELGIGLLSYSMTHHTRQSALGLPVIRHKEYGGEGFDVSEYTMSEIISAIYDLMEQSGVQNGILFLDEINCVSETLVPVMLQFLQYKVFGGHRIPDGWIVVTAGNPPEYNSSVRGFDIATWDRLKRIDVEPDLSVWKEYAYAAGVHRAVLTFLEIKPQNFYKIESTAGGKQFVTARGWDDLSRILTMYERLGIEVDSDLIKQYIQSPRIAEDFAAYYELYRKYMCDYRIDDILAGAADDELKERARAARFDERYSLLGLLLEAAGHDAGGLLRTDKELTDIKAVLEKLRGAEDVQAAAAAEIAKADEERARLAAANSLSEERDSALAARKSRLTKYRAKGDFEGMKKAFAADVAAYKERMETVKSHFHNMFAFCEEVFGSGQEMLILVTELAAAPVTAKYISLCGCDDYYRFDKELMLFERRLSLIEQLTE